MGWKEILRYGEGTMVKHGVMDKEARVDDGVPLGAQVGSLINMQQTPFIRAVTEGSLIAMPTDADKLIKAISHVKLDLAGKLYRFYVSTGDTDDKERFLQVFAEADGTVREIMYCTRLVRIIPESREDQDTYTGRGGRGLGELQFSIWREQVAGLGYNDSDLNSMFKDADRFVYQRDAGNQSDRFVAPFAGREVRVDDAKGVHGLEQEIYFMPYVRELGSGKEYLLIETEIVESQDGDASRRDIHVDFMIGIPVERERVVIQ